MMKIFLAILVYLMLVYGSDGQTTVPPEYTTEQNTINVETPIPVPTTIVTSISTTNTTSNFGMDRGYRNPRWKVYRPNQWTPIPVPIWSRPVTNRSRYTKATCGSIYKPYTKYQVTNHDKNGRCRDCDRAMNKNKILNKIIGGKRIRPMEIPWNIELYRYDGQFKGCGATLISPTKIITAAHCFSDDLWDYVTYTIPSHNGFEYRYKAVGGLTRKEIHRNSHYSMQKRDIGKIVVHK